MGFDSGSTRQPLPEPLTYDVVRGIGVLRARCSRRRTSYGAWKGPGNGARGSLNVLAELIAYGR